MAIVSKVAELVQNVLGPLAEEVARDVPIIKRRRKFSASTLAQTLIWGFLAKRNPSDADLARTALLCDVEVSPQAIEQRFTPTLVTFLKVLFLRAVEHRIQADQAVASLLQRFSAVFLLDSSSVTLPDELKVEFPGRGGSFGGGQAAVKFQVRLDLRGGTLDAVAPESGRTCDQGTPRQRDPLPAGSLRITDLGYFDTKTFRSLENQGAFWLSRLSVVTEIFTSTGEPIQQIEDLFKGGQRFVDCTILLGKGAKHACRLVGWRVPEEVANRRRQKLDEVAREKGTPPPSRKRLDWCDWTLFVTNVSPDQLSGKEIAVLYRARWQVELLFKRWKSLGGIAEMSGSTTARRMARMWLRMLVTLLQQWFLQATGWGDGRCSYYKAWQVIRDQASQVARALGSVETLIKEIELMGRLIAKTARRDKRKQPGTFELLNDPSLLEYEA